MSQSIPCTVACAVVVALLVGEPATRLAAGGRMDHLRELAAAVVLALRLPLVLPLALALMLPLALALALARSCCPGLV